MEIKPEVFVQFLIPSNSTWILKYYMVNFHCRQCKVPTITIKFQMTLGFVMYVITFRMIASICCQCTMSMRLTRQCHTHYHGIHQRFDITGSLTHWGWHKMAAYFLKTFSYAFSWMKIIKISLKFVPKGPINNIPALVQIMAWQRPGAKPFSEPMMFSLLKHINASLGLNE